MSITVRKKPDGRGFMQYEETHTDYGDVLRLSESSAAKGPCAWITTGIVRDKTRGAAVGAEAVVDNNGVHMTYEQVATLHAQLGDWLQHGFKVDELGDDEKVPVPSPAYPYAEGDWIVLGPEIFAGSAEEGAKPLEEAKEKTVICWQGMNFVPQEEAP